ncbi:MAG TPA: ABC transporter permease [Actinomycetota bacterium]|nr:ABC transporter permease [Actinomycetota bacterium]
MIAALIRRDFVTARSYRTAFVMDTAFGFLNLLVYYFISQAIGPISSNLQGAPSYFAFAAVGASMTLVIQAATTGLARRIREEQLTGTLEALVGQPITSTEIALGIAGFPFMFAMVRAAAYILFASTFLGLSLAGADWIGFAVVLFCSGAALGAVGILLCALVVMIKRGDSLIILTTFALGLLGGAVFPRLVLPDWVQKLTVIVPTRYSFDGVRNALFLGQGWADDASGLLLATAILFPLGMAAFGFAIGFARRRGTLGEY